MKDYYEVLQVSRTASKEIIDKAYKVLAKKYHPDLQEQGQKENAEKMMKEINEAYEVLSNDQKREAYDNELKYKEEQEKQQQVQNQSQYQNQNQAYNNSSDNYNNYNNNQVYNQQNATYQEESLTKEQLKELKKKQRKAEKKAREEYVEEQERIYRNFYRSLGYKVKERWTWKRFKRLLVTLGAIALFILILWIFPPTHKLLVETYEESPFFRGIIQIIAGIFKGIGKGLIAFIKSIFGK